MATSTNFTRNQGEIFRITIDMEDNNCFPMEIADSNKNPLIFFAGVATKSGQTDVPIRFKMQDVETVTYGRGSNRQTATGVFKVYAYIPADEVGSCDLSQYENRTDCEAHGGTWTVDANASLLTTSNMAVGDWSYQIRIADADDVSNLEAAITILSGTLTITESEIDVSAGASFTFSAPAA